MKPRIFIEHGNWWCVSPHARAYGRDWMEAYARWRVSNEFETLGRG